MYVKDMTTGLNDTATVVINIADANTPPFIAGYIAANGSTGATLLASFVVDVT